MQVHVNIFIVENILNQPELMIVLEAQKLREDVDRMLEVELRHQDRWKKEEEDCCCYRCSSGKEANECEGILYK